MKKKLLTEFNRRQYMVAMDYEIFYYSDFNALQVSPHLHDHYEYYFFLEGDLHYEIDGISYTLLPGDFLLIPPHTKHQPHIQTLSIPYRRIILWISKDYYHKLCLSSPDFSYGFDCLSAHSGYHFRPDFLESRSIQSQLLEIIEEIHSNRAFHELHSQLKITYLLMSINRIIYELMHPVSPGYDNALYLSLCDYINNHLNEDLSLDTLAAFFYVSKYHISHIFKDNMGISLHQYILKKRVQAVKNGILAGIPVNQLCHEVGFRDYTSLYRAFKKEFGISPKEYKQQHQLTEESFIT